jgi:ketosteroid isomerase-like protein
MTASIALPPYLAAIFMTVNPIRHAHICYNAAVEVLFPGEQLVLHFLALQRKRVLVDDLYAINVLKTEIREAYNTGSPERLLAVLDDGIIYYADARKSGYRESGRQALREYLTELFGRYNARLVPIVIEIKFLGDAALEYGWHELTLTPKDGGDPLYTRTRYLDVWRKHKAGGWKLVMFMDNADVPDRIGGQPG